MKMIEVVPLLEDDTFSAHEEDGKLILTWKKRAVQEVGDKIIIWLKK